MRGWENWYHCVGSTYGSWLPGDPRGWRTRKHRVHVEGDYKNPPLVDSTLYHQHAERLMKRSKVVLMQEQRRIVLEVLRQAFAHLELPLAAVAVSRTHAHVLARFAYGRRTRAGKLITNPPRHFFGIARKHAARALSDSGASQGGVWSKRTKISRSETVNTSRTS